MGLTGRACYKIVTNREAVGHVYLYVTETLAEEGDRP